MFNRRNCDRKLQFSGILREPLNSRDVCIYLYVLAIAGQTAEPNRLQYILTNDNSSSPSYVENKSIFYWVIFIFNLW